MSPDGISDFFIPREYSEKSRKEYEIWCQETWGLKPQWNWVTDYFGGKDHEDFKYLKNVVFANG